MHLLLLLLSLFPFDNVVDRQGAFRKHTGFPSDQDVLVPKPRFPFCLKPHTWGLIFQQELLAPGFPNLLMQTHTLLLQKYRHLRSVQAPRFSASIAGVQYKLVKVALYLTPCVNQKLSTQNGLQMSDPGFVTIVLLNQDSHCGVSNQKPFRQPFPQPGAIIILSTFCLILWLIQMQAIESSCMSCACEYCWLGLP